VTTWVGTCSGEAKNRALSARVRAVSVLTRVRDARDDDGSLKARWPLPPIPTTWRSTPPGGAAAEDHDVDVDGLQQDPHGCREVPADLPPDHGGLGVSGGDRRDPGDGGP
jgi:hypothetical protein